MSNVSSDFNLQRITTSELSDNIRATIECGGNMIVIGRRGSGKTMIAKDIIKKSGCKEVYWNLSVMERPDIGGYPNFFAAQSGQKFVNFLLPSFYQELMEGDTPVVALLDEVDKADPSLWAPLLELTQFHTMNGRALPNLKAIISTGNLQSEGGNRPSPPLLDRAEKYLVEASHEQWLNWASTANIHASISAFIADHPEELYGDVDPGDAYADPSPRGWHNASNVLNFGENKRWPHGILTNKVSGYVGKKTGIKYSAYFEHYQVLLPIVDRIMRGETIREFGNLEPSKQMVACMIVCNRLARIIDENIKNNKKEKPAAYKTVANFLNTVDVEMALISVKSNIGIERVVGSGIDTEPEWDKVLRMIASRING